MRGHTPPPFPPLPSTRDLGVIGPMARCAADLSLLLDVIAGPDPLEAGKAYQPRAAAAAPHGAEEFSRAGDRHRSGHADRQAWCAARWRQLAANLAKAGVRSSAQSAVAGLRRIEPALHADADVVPCARPLRRKSIAGAQAAAAALPADDSSLAAERLRGIALSHRDWLMADGGRSRLRAQWRELFKTYDAVICPIMPTPAYPHDHSRRPGKTPHQDRRQGLRLSRPALLARHRHLARPALHRDPDRLFAGWTAGRRADRRPLAGRPHALEAGRTDRARIRRLQAAADV